MKASLLSALICVHLRQKFVFSQLLCRWMLGARRRRMTLAAQDRRPDL
jgi:hypothetical protein